MRRSTYIDVQWPQTNIFAAVRLHSIARSESAQMFSTVSYLIERKIQPLERSPHRVKLVDLVQREMIENDNRQKAPV